MADLTSSPAYPRDLAAAAERSLLKLGVRVQTEIKVTGGRCAAVSTIERADGKTDRIPTHTVVWAGGVTASDFGRTLANQTGARADNTGPDRGKSGSDDTQLARNLRRRRHGRNQGPGRQAAAGCRAGCHAGGGYAARAIVNRLQGAKELPPFHYFDKGDLAVIGRGHAIARIFGLRLSGWIAWLVWVFIHLMYLVQFQSRIVVFIQWGFQYFTWSRGARLITGFASRSWLPSPGATLGTAAESASGTGAESVFPATAVKPVQSILEPIGHEGKSAQVPQNFGVGPGGFTGRTHVPRRQGIFEVRNRRQRIAEQPHINSRLALSIRPSKVVLVAV